MKPIHLILSIALLAGGACGDQQEPYYGNSEVKMPQIDSEWNLELMPNRSGQYWKVFVYKDLKYNALFTRSLGWNGGDGVFTTGLPDGNIFWSFNDSFYGVINENRSRGNCSFPRNSIMVQTPGEKDENLVWLADYVQTNDPNADRYYQVRTHIRHPKATLSDEKIQAGEIDQDYLYWAGDATIYNNQMQMLWGAVDNTDPNNLMRRFGTCLATYSLEGKPGDATYMKLISRNDNFNDHTLGYGDTMWEDEDGHLYLVRLTGKGEEYRNDIITRMAENGVACNVHFKPLPMHTAYKNLGFHIEDFPNAYEMYHNEITLPLHTCLTDEQADYVIDTFCSLVK